MKNLILTPIFLILILSSQTSAQQKDPWTTFTTANGLAGNDVRDIFEASDGALWFATHGGGVSKLKTDKFPPNTVITQSPQIITGTSTPMFVFKGNVSRTERDKLLYAYTVFDSENSVTAGDSLDFSWIQQFKQQSQKTRPILLL